MRGAAGNVAPEDRIVLCVQSRDAAKTTFYEVDCFSAARQLAKPCSTPVLSPNWATATLWRFSRASQRLVSGVSFG